MRRFLVLATIGALVGGLGWFFDRHGFNGLERLKRPNWLSAADETAEAEDPAAAHRPPLRIATFKLRAFRQETLDDPRAREVLIEVVRGFDILALEGLDDSASEAIADLVASASASERRYDFVIGPATGRRRPQRPALLFDTERVELDRSALYQVADPDRLLAHPPLAAWFRARGLSSAAAFTFTVLVADSGPSEFEALAAACRAVRDDGRGEDDLIVAGDFGGDQNDLKPLLDKGRLTATIVGVPTNTVGDRQEANILYSRAAIEYTGRAGVMDLVRQFNLTVAAALAISDHAPVWAEFACAERDADPFAAAGRADRATFGGAWSPRPAFGGAVEQLAKRPVEAPLGR